MRNLLTSFLALLIPTFISATTSISIHIDSDKEEDFLYYYPSEGEFTLLSRTNEKTDEKGILNLKLDITKAGFVYIFPQLKYKRDGWHAIQLYVERDSDISIFLNKENPESSLRFEGDLDRRYM